MSRGRLLVVTSVHRPDDARIRAKLIPTLAAEWDITYATRLPGPVDQDGITWVPLTGSRLGRAVGGGRLLLSKRWDLVAVHDPDLLPAAMLRSWFRRATLFDLHENLPAQLRSRAWIPRLLRGPLSFLARWVLRLAERSVYLTLAESGYASLFRRHHPVLANYLPESIPDPVPAARPPFLAYLGDVSTQRGADLALVAAAGAGMRLVMVGRVAPDSLATDLEKRAAAAGVELELTGEMAHAEALATVAPAVGGLSPLLDIGNYRDSLPTKVPEYLALGLPVLASDLPGTRDPLQGLDAVELVAPGDELAWKSAGAALAADPSRRAAAAGQVREVKDRFAWRVDVILSAYREAARR